MNLIFPVSWLRDYLKTDAVTKTIANYLTLSGPSVDSAKKVGEDYIFDVEVTTNRNDAFSVFGIAREGAAILSTNSEKAQLIEPDGINLDLKPDVTKKTSLDVKITDPKLCPRFSAIVCEIVIKESPALIKNRLKACGIRPINNIVDITNYVMLEVGNPMHAFDFDKIEDAKMILRTSIEGEKLTTLDGQKRDLPKGSIVIQDEKKLIDLCGIMGGANSQVTSRTKRVLFFAQAYDGIRIRKTTQALAFRTDAAARFEKGVDTENVLRSLSRAVYLAKKTADAIIISELIDIYPQKPSPKIIRLSFEKLNKYLGVDVPKEKGAKILQNLGFAVKTHSNLLEATVPTWRTVDMSQDVDLIEEIARVWGYHNLPSILPQSALPLDFDSELKDVIELKKTLTSLGLVDVVTYSIISKKTLEHAQIAEKNSVELENPLSEEWQFMRPTIIPSLCEVIATNQKTRDTADQNLKIFEIAKTYQKNRKGLPQQDLNITLAFEKSDFWEIKGLVELITKILKRETKYEKLKDKKPLFQQENSSLVKIGDQVIGTVGLLDQKIANHFGIEGKLAIAELNLSAIFAFPQKISTFHPIPKFPPIIEDISAVFYTVTPLDDIIAEIKRTSSLVKKVELLDTYQGDKIGTGKKSITLSLQYQKLTSTPTQEEVNLERKKITKALETKLRAKVRI